jgi:hypothetical protein
VKTRETSPDRFDRFSVNRPVKFEIFKNLKTFEIKNYKKTRVYFKIFGQNRIQKHEVTHPTKFGEGERKGKPGKKENDWFLIRGATLRPYPQALDLIPYRCPLPHCTITGF